MRTILYNDLSTLQRELLDAAAVVMETAYNPYSRFFVGAALLTKDNQIITGSNVENAAYGNGICAERSALFRANAMNYRQYKSIAVIARGENADTKEVTAPCGSCRQSIYEASQISEQNLCPSIFFLNAGMAGEKVIENPNAFNLEMHEKIMAVNYFGVLAFVECWEKPCQENGGANFIVTSSVNAIFAAPTGSAYCASKAAISKAFESLSLTYFGTNLKFSSIYTGPVATDGLKGNWPFTWKPEKMAKYMADFSTTGKSRGEPSLFYGVVCRLLRALPHRLTMKILKKV